MPKPSYICNCDVIHEDIVNDVKSKMQPKDDYIQLASLFKLFGDGTRVQILHALEPVSYTHLVTDITAGGRDFEVTVNFDRAGTKKMFAAFAKLKKL